jgi:hypothetical protein
MFQLTRISNLAGVAAFVALAATSLPARADEADENWRTVAPRSSVFDECQVLRRAIARRACDARLERDQLNDAAEQVTDSQIRGSAGN